jgi:hypothetical protein
MSHFRPTLLVGVGGTGSKIAESVLERAVRNNSALRSHIGIIALDTDVNDMKDLKHVEPRSRLGFSRPETVYRLIERNPDAERAWCLDRKTMPPVVQSLSLIEGAGQVRMLTRLALHDSFAHGDLMGRLEDALARLAAHSDDQNFEGHVHVLVVGSLAGATGSGSFAQIALALRAAAETRQIKVTVRGVFLLPDVYARSGALSSTQVPNVLANGYASLKELNAFTIRGILPDRATDFDFEYVPGQRLKSNLIPYEAITFIDYENVRGGNIGRSLESYLAMAARAGYQMVFSPLGAKYGAVTVNDVRQKIAELSMGGINLYSGIGIASVTYPADALRTYLTRRLVLENLRGDWAQLDQRYEAQLQRFRDEEAAGVSTGERPDIRQTYVRDLEQLARQEPRVPFYRKAWDFLNPVLEDPRTGQRTVVPRAKSFVDSVLSFVDGRFWDDKVLGPIKTASALDSTSLLESDSLLDTVRKAETGLDANFEALEAALQSLPVNIYQNDLVSSDTLRPEEALAHHIQSVILKDSPHPVTVRAFLYMALQEVDARLRRIDPADTRLKLFRLANRFRSDDEIQATSNRPASRGSARVIDLASEAQTARGPLAALLGGKRKKFAADYVEYYNETRARLVDWARQSIEHRVLGQLEAELNAAIRAYQGLFAEIADLARSLEAGIRKDAALHGSQSAFDGNSYVYANAVCQEDAWRRVQTAASGLRLDESVNRNLVAAVHARYREDRRMRRDTDFKEIRGLFEREVVQGFAARVVRNDFASAHDFSVIEAMRRQFEAEALAENRPTPLPDAEIRRQIKAVVDRVSRQSEPYLALTNPDSAGSQIKFWALNPKIQSDVADPTLFGDMFRFSAGDNPIVIEDFSAQELLCVNLRVNLKLEDFAKLAPAREAEDNALAGTTGRYTASYDRMIRAVLAGERNNGKGEITPHVDRTWHTPGVLPEIFDSEQDKTRANQARAFVVARALGLIRLEAADDGAALARFSSRGRGLRDAMDESFARSHRPWPVWQEFIRKSALVQSALSVWNVELQQEFASAALHPAFARMTDPALLVMLLQPIADRGDGAAQRDEAAVELVGAWLTCLDDLIRTQDVSVSEPARQSRLRSLFHDHRASVLQAMTADNARPNVLKEAERVMDMAFDSFFSQGAGR